MERLIGRSTLAIALSCLLIACPAWGQDHAPIANMKTAPNQTVVTGRLQTFQPAADGYGGNLVIEVVSNETPVPSTDFIRPQTGKLLRAFYPEPSERAISSLMGRLVRVNLTFLGGPSGGRAVVQNLEAVSPRK